MVTPKDPRWDLKKARLKDRGLVNPMDLRLVKLTGCHLVTLTESKLVNQRVYHWVMHLDWWMVPTTVTH